MLVGPCTDTPLTVSDRRIVVKILVPETRVLAFGISSGTSCEYYFSALLLDLTANTLSALSNGGAVVSTGQPIPIADPVPAGNAMLATVTVENTGDDDIAFSIQHGDPGDFA